MSVGTETFLRLLREQQQAAPTPMANIQRPYQVQGARGLVPAPMALRRPTPPSAMPTMPKLSPMMQAIANRAAMSKLTPGAGQVGLPTGGAGGIPQPSAPTMPQGGGAPAATTFGQRFAQPQTQALLGAAIAGAEASGYQDTPVSLGQVLGRMGAGAMGGYQAAEDRQTKLASALAAAQRQKRLDEEKAAYDAEMLRLKRIEVGGASEKEAFGNEKQLRSEFDKQAKVFDEARLGFEKVQKAAMTEAPTGATDIALIFGYMKVIDPTSVVREGEFATAENAGGIGSKLRNTYNKIVKGERLAPSVRQDFVRAARTQFMPYLDRQKNVEDRYSTLSDAYGLDASKVVLSRLPKTGTLARPYTTFATQADAEAANLPKGTYVMIGNQLFIED